MFTNLTQAALKRRDNESVLAIQPHQADQPTHPEKSESSESRGLWRTLLIWGAVVVGVLCLAAVAPLCHYGGRLRPLPTLTQPIFVQRLVGKPDSNCQIFALFSSSNP